MRKKAMSEQQKIFNQKFNQEQVEKAKTLFIKGAMNEINSSVTFCAILAILASMAVVNKGELLGIFKQVFHNNVEKLKGNPELVGLPEDANKIINVDASIDTVKATYLNVVEALLKGVQDGAKE